MANRLRNNEFPCFLYVLEDPRKLGELRYIGFTTSLPQRISTHLARARKDDRYSQEPLYQWIKELLKAGIEPKMRVLGQGKMEELLEKEELVIRSYKKMGFPLLNQSSGGAGCPGFRWSDEARKAHSIKLLGKKKHAGHGVAVSKALKGRSKSPEHIQALRAAWEMKRLQKGLNVKA